jgi:Rrf2 family protein
MRISTRGVYALEAMLVLASLPEHDRVSIRRISEQTGLSDSYLEQIFAMLKRSGLLVSNRGSRGGYVLGRPAAEISAGDIIRAAEGSLRPVACTDAALTECARAQSCLSRPVWCLLEQEIPSFLDAITLAALQEEFQAMEKSGRWPDPIEYYL